jgi:hypothetical protein
MQRTKTVALGAFSLESLGGAYRRDTATLGRSLTQAIRYYLADMDSGRAGWPYPSFGRDANDGQVVELRVSLDSAIWDDFSKEADRQGVSTGQLVQHAALYFAADRDSGRLAQRIVSDIGNPERDPGRPERDPGRPEGDPDNPEA